ncbi:bifunctional lysylphosphatidylglycerol flippase/synthetase MprF [Hyphomicrobium sp.]|uniref:bifunctional lysylphosphatidylglycerol flippase/synthetase MprF n=1 Tax=Hyphomicrobium sp. TaxID=82 RepID=UPI002E3427A9|nr:bifunctional lysylphosphatidylglycerol flippase/synthetase MprF [Hyphomicrobium sp.]HEX2841061.1 bifunctional lysylphosphatidylglycerol flippase/synthetase MprF [Hyphomicrobium sp.]
MAKQFPKAGSQADAIPEPARLETGEQPDEAVTEAAQGTLARLIGSARVRAGLVLALFAIVSYALYHEIEVTSWHEVRAALAATQLDQIGFAALGTAISYFALTGYDVLALRHLGVPRIPFGTVALTSFISQAFTFTFGFGVLTGGAVRMRLYGAAGIKPDQILATSVFATLAIWIGIAAVVGVALLAAPDVAQTVLSLPESGARLAGLLLLGSVAWVWWFSATKRPTLPGLNVPAPDATVTGLALLVGAVDILASGFALWALLPSEVTLSFPAFLVIFASAIALGVISHVPGGLGVFEGIILLAIPTVPASALLASLLLFRFVYYLLPMVLAAVALAVVEIRERHAILTKHVSRLGSSLGASIPLVSATLVFLGGFILMVSGALPAEHQRMAILRYTVPLPFVEASHFVASIIGTLLLIVAYGLARRLESAWRVATILLLLGATFSLLKGIDYEEAVVCLTIAGLLIVGRRWFYRKGGILSGSLQSSEILAIGLASITSIWIGFLAFRDVSYDDSLWWDFAYRGDASRFLRATVGVAVTVLATMAYRLLHRSAPVSNTAPREDLKTAAPIVNASEFSSANLALIGDKRFLFNADKTGFVMYGTQGSSWIAMGDPIVTADADPAALVWQFKELVDRHSGIPAFYQVASTNLPLYLDAGFSMVKLGEEAWVDLRTFTLEGAEGRKLRQAMSKSQRMGATFEIIPAAEVEPLLPDLRRVSEAWLAEKKQKEKGFSLGYWTDAYMRLHDVGLVRIHGRIAAFANIWRSANRHEMSIDIMRVRHDAPNGTMDFLFTALMDNAKGEGYRWFNLGMAPLSGLPQHRLAPLWSRLGTWLSRHGDRFYKFEGLRLFKNKFRPEWRPKYLAYPSGVLLPQILLDVTTLISSAPARSRTEELVS